MKKLMLIDGHSIMNRAFYAIPILTNKDGQYTNAIYGFLNILFKLIDEEKPNYIGVSFDLNKPTFRHLEYSEYKGNRRKMPEELRSQIPIIKEILNVMKINIYEKEGFEADDILATIAKKAEDRGICAVIVSGDRDLLQVATDKIKIKIPKTKLGKTEMESYFAKDVFKRYGVTPKEFIEVKALMGDSSDNIPGVPSIGEKTAIKIITQYKTVESAIENAQNIKPKKASDNIIQHKEQALLSKYLVTINDDVAIDFIDEETNDILNDDFFIQCKKYELKSILSKFDKRITQDDVKFNLIENVKDAKDYFEKLPKDEEIAYKMIYDENIFIGISFTTKNDNGTFIKVYDGIEEKQFFDIYSSFFGKQYKKLTLDAKTDIIFLNKYSIGLENVVFDAMIGAYILNPSINKYEYNDVANTFLTKEYESKDELLGTRKSKKFIYDIEKEKWFNYCVRQSYVVFLSKPIIEKKIQENNQQELFYDVEMPLIKILASMEICGIRICKEELLQYKKEFDDEIKRLEEEIYWIVGEKFKINSPLQLGNILFEKLKLPYGKKNSKGYSTSADILEKLVNKHEVIPRIITYRSYTKIKSTFIDGLLNGIDEKTMRIYSKFNQTATATGRISSAEPNLQNIPIKIEIGHKVRKVFKPEEDYVFIDADYSQIELRVLAHLSQDEKLINAFNEGEDIHKLTASEIFNKPLDEVLPKERSAAKAINFGLIYGKQAFSLAQDLDISIKQADEYINGYFEKYPKVKKFLDDCIEYAKENGYTKTMFNRIRYIPEINSKSFIQKGVGQRIAMNTPIQGMAADIIKIAMIKVYNRMKKENLKSRLILQVHDELLIETYKDEKEIVKTILKDEMENAVDFSIKLLIEINEGESWYDTK